MDYQFIIVEELPDYYEKATWNLYHAYIDTHIQRLIYECSGYGVKISQYYNPNVQTLPVMTKADIM